jgi:benzoyl-CoA reductase/2-hydroxyglutaryl-CoA dehydratase subunit BcrC/BadD/HgdB
MVNPAGGSLDELMDRLVERYMKIDCACFTPNSERLDHIVEMARSSGVEGVIHYSLQFCTPYLMEAKKVSDACKKSGIPMLAVETDYSMGDTEQLKTRIGAFLESL